MTKSKEEQEKSSLEKLVFDDQRNKYQMIAYTIRWCRHLSKNNEEHKTTQELLYKAIEDVYSGNVSFKEIEKKN
ncbi:MAG: hypothetical protein ABII27_07105 [bacterium]